MAQERILDIGIGTGGTYINDHTAPNEQRIGVDLRLWELASMRASYPDVLPVKASGERLPFADNTFSRIEIVMPWKELLIPGIQIGHDMVGDKWKREFKRRCPHGWYPEFQRVLIPQGELVLVADLRVDPDQVQETAYPLFNLKEKKRLSEAEFNDIGTITISKISDEHRTTRYLEFLNSAGKKWEDSLVKIILRSTKKR